MRAQFLLIASCLLALVAFAPSAAADSCVIINDNPPYGIGGVTGMTYTYAADVGNAGLGQACGPTTTPEGAYGFADDLADLTCQYLIGLDCI
ncbi:MAG: hypothetical protein QOJ26_1007 [Thermoplasmata archaeon]|nr:hypothetical protein [Thermoplasmata archaeon]MEA3166138.1 hypothetical protein [Thermoplasmata archaeon]